MDSKTPSILSHSFLETRFPPLTGADLKLRFVGGVNGVTGSCAWLHHEPSDVQFLVDCGMFQGDTREQLGNQLPFPFDPRMIRYVLLTHAHLDHCGMLPRLVNEGFRGLVYATEATCDLARVMLVDAVKLNSDLSPDVVDQINWSPIDVDLGFKWGRGTQLADGLVFCCKRSSHVLGACSFTVNWKPTRNEVANGWEGICFSGDVGRQGESNSSSLLLKHGQNPFPSTKYLVVESTYGGRVRDTKSGEISERLTMLADVIGSAKSKGGTAFFPAFAFHRSQEVLVDILCASRVKHLGPLHVAIHSPLAQNVTKIYARHLLKCSPNGKRKYFNEECLDWLGVEDSDFSRFLEALAQKGKAAFKEVLVEFVSGAVEEKAHHDLVIASSGMCDHGASAKYLKSLAGDERNAIVFTGHLAPGSAGRKFLDNAQNSASRRGCRVDDLSSFYSGHADQSGLLDFVFLLGGYEQGGVSHVLINHGEARAKPVLLGAITERSSLAGPEDRKIGSIKIANARWLDLV